MKHNYTRPARRRGKWNGPSICRPANRQLRLEPLERRLLLSAVKEPYLQAVTMDSIYVLVEADNIAADARVDYGLSYNNYDSHAITESTEYTDRGNYVHNVKLTDLLPNTQYHYSVTHGVTTSADKTFWTAAQPGTDFRFGFMADSRSDAGTGLDQTVHGKMAALMDTFDPRMIVFGGDTNEYATWDSWNQDFFISQQQTLNAEVPFANAPGNHEGWNALTRAYTQGPNGDGDGYFSYDYGDVHFLILNNEISDGSDSAQWDFAKEDLETTTQPWKIVSFHKPAYSVGGHGGDVDMLAMTAQIFEPNGVDMVLTGHNHYYQHNLVNGIHHMVIGSTNAPLTDPGTETYTVNTEKTYCLGIFDATATTLDYTAYREDGSEIETINLSKGPDVTPPTLDSVLATSQTTVEVVFSEPVELGSAQNIENYSIDPVVTISLAILQADTETVVLTVSPLALNVTYTLTVNNVEDVAGNPIDYTHQTFEYDAQQTLSFQQGAGGYIGTVDTMLREAVPSIKYDASSPIGVDDENPAPSEDQVLMRFDGIIGDGASQIPLGSTINSATLTVQVTNPGSGLSVHRMLQSWDDFNTWNDLGGGVQADDSEAVLLADIVVGVGDGEENIPTGPLNLNVTAGLQAWADGAIRMGWAMLPLVGGWNGIDFYSAEGTTPPKLVVNFVPAPNNPPVAVNDSYSVAEGGTLTANDADGTIGDASDDGVLVNDTDPDLPDDTLTVNTTPVSGPAYGSLTLSADGTFVYTHDGSENFNDSFTYEVSDALDATDTATASIIVTPVNDNDPVFTSGTTADVEESTTSVMRVTATDADLPPQTVSYSISGGVDEAAFAIDPVSGELAFQSPPDYDIPGDPDGDNVYHVEVMAADGAGGTAAQSIAVSVVPTNEHSPVFTSSDTASVAENTTPVVTLTATDADLPAQMVTFSITGGADQVAFAVNSTSGALSFASAPDYEVPGDVGDDNVYNVDVTADDGFGGTAVQSITVTVTPVNDNDPVFTSGTTADVAENTTAVMTVNAGDADLPAQMVTFSITGGADQVAFAVNSTSGALSFVSAPDFDPLGDNVYLVDVTANDGGGGTAVQNMAVTVIAAVRVYDSGQVDLEIPDQGTLTATLTVDDSFSIADLDVELNINHSLDQELGVFLISPGGTRVELFTDVGGRGDNFTGTILDDEASELIADGVAAFTGRYQPEGNLSDFDGGDVGGDWTLEITDDKRRTGGTLVSWSLTVTPGVPNQPPVADDDAAETDEDTSVTVSVLANDDDPDGGTLSLDSVDTTGTRGLVIDNGDGTITYDPAGLFDTLKPGESEEDTFSYTLGDGQSGTDTATVTVTISGVNDLPTAGDDSYSTAVDTQLNVAAPGVLGNDADPDDPLTLTTGPYITDQGVQVTLNADGGSFVYDPPAGFTGTDSFTYTVTGGSDATTGTVTIDVNETPVETIIDDGDAGYEDTGWKSKANEGAYGGDYSYATAGDVSETATWTFDGLAAGDYDVFATWVSQPIKHASNAPYTVMVDDLVIEEVPVNQRVAPDGQVVAGWQILGTYTIDGGTLTVKLSNNNADGYVIADAIRIVPAAPAGAGMAAESSAAADPDASQLAAIDFILGQDDSDPVEEDLADELAILLLSE
ncbi:MAG: tandem-95 repeat protein [Candidatus Nealsonbacteria bacterium]|nr:tandem-95 repeat protein [Candidatus Nealsonbacteria bacterium]